MTISHRMSGTITYRKWAAMRSRCYNHNASAYHKYGARGITICERWRESFENFYADMGECPPGMSIGRIDNNGPYSPENCRWETDAQQARNKRNTRRIVIDGVERSLPEWCEINAVPVVVAYARIHRLGWDDKRAVTTPPKPRDFLRGRPANISPEVRQALRDKALRQWEAGGIGDNRKREVK